MTDEEKKAIERLIIYKDKIKDELYPIIDFEEEKAIGIILNLIEKQSKEIEELNKENLEIRDWKYVIDSPIDLDKLKELDLIKIKGKEFISKDKIKAKIEELDNEKRQWIEDRDNKHKDSEIIYAIEILQVLLGSEE